MNTLKRFESQYIPEPMSGCWLWTGSTRRFGYGCFLLNRKDIAAHRASWILHKGKIPVEMCILHKCDVPQCVNPDHLFLGTRADNVQDMIKKGRGNNQLKTHCKHGHELSGDNLYVTTPNKSRRISYRQCKKCIYAAGKRRNEKLKGNR